MIVAKSPEWRASLSFNIIGTRTDPRVLERMFKSIAHIADQIVVIGDDKADEAFYTIARAYTDDLFMYPWRKDFALARNRALLHSRGDYVAWIDTDEFYEPAVASRIYNLMHRPMGKAFYVWQVSAKNNGEVIYVPQVRIFPNVPGARWEIPIHEQILPSLQRIGVPTELTDLRVVHYGYYQPRQVVQKHKRNLPLLARRVRTNPEDAFTRSNYEKAIAYERSVRRRAL